MPVASARNGPRPVLLVGILVLLVGVLVPAGCQSDRAASAALHHLRNRGMVHFERGTAAGYGRAAEFFGRAVEVSGGDPDDRLNLVRALVFSREKDAASRALEVIDSITAGRPAKVVPVAALFLEGLAAKRHGLDARASAAFQAVTERDPECAAAWYQLGSLLLSAKNWSGAIEALARAARQGESFVGVAALYKLSQAHRLAGDTPAADRVLGEFRKRRTSLPQGSPGEAVYERSRYTRVTIIPARRRESEPPAVGLQLREAGRWPTGKNASLVVLDVDGDGNLDWISLAASGSHLLRNTTTPGGPPAFEDITAIAGLDEALTLHGMPGATAGDADNDGLVDLYLFGEGMSSVLARSMGEGIFEPADDAGTTAGPRVEDARWVDTDHDGDLDVVLLQRAGENAGASRHAHILRNNGDLTFVAMNGASADAPDLLAGSIAAAAATTGRGVLDFADFDLGNDIDIVVPGVGGAVIFRNRRAGPFQRDMLPGLAGNLLLFADDLDGDGDPDILALPATGTPLRVAWNESLPSAAGQSTTGTLPPLRLRIEAPRVEGASAAAIDGTTADLDSDGDLDAVLVTGDGLLLLRNRAGESFAVEKIPGPAGLRPERLRVADLDGDGQLDLLLAGSRDDGTGSEVRLLRNENAGNHTGFTIRLVGTRDNRAGVGSTIELFSGKLYERVQVRGPEGAHLGLGPDRRPEGVDGLRILWPNGITQAVLPAELVPGDRHLVKITQKEGLSVSCPFLFVFDGERYRYLTDVIAIAPLDEWLPPGEPAHLDPEEFVRIPGDLLAPAAGEDVLRLAITEELRETTYLDFVALIEVRHPADVEVFGRESTLQQAREPLEVFVVPAAEIRSPEHAPGLTAAVDGRYHHGYTIPRPQWEGWSEPHAIEIRHDDTAAARALLLRGRVIWPDSDVRFSLAQHDRQWQPLRVEIPGDGDGDSVWRTVIDDAGLPTGMDRVMVVDLGPRGLSLQRGLRLTTTFPILWDWIAVARRGEWKTLDADGRHRLSRGGDAAGDIVLERRTVPLRQARISFHGFSAVVGDRARHEHRYDFHHADPGAVVGLSFRRPGGFATPHGDVRPLVLARDDRLVVLVSGDGLGLTFEAPGPLPPGMARTYFLQLNGWAKEANFHNPTGRWIGPLPFQAMSCYPPLGGRPGDERHDGSVEERYQFQTRWVQR